MRYAKEHDIDVQGVSYIDHAEEINNAKSIPGTVALFVDHWMHTADAMRIKRPPPTTPLPRPVQLPPMRITLLIESIPLSHLRIRQHLTAIRRSTTRITPEPMPILPPPRPMPLLPQPTRLRRMQTQRLLPQILPHPLQPRQRMKRMRPLPPPTTPLPRPVQLPPMRTLRLVLHTAQQRKPPRQPKQRPQQRTMPLRQRRLPILPPPRLQKPLPQPMPPLPMPVTRLGMFRMLSTLLLKLPKPAILPQPTQTQRRLLLTRKRHWLMKRRPLQIQPRQMRLKRRRLRILLPMPQTLPLTPRMPLLKRSVLSSLRQRKPLLPQPQPKNRQ